MDYSWNSALIIEYNDTDFALWRKLLIDKSMKKLYHAKTVSEGISQFNARTPQIVIIGTEFEEYTGADAIAHIKNINTRSPYGVIALADTIDKEIKALWKPAKPNFLLKKEKIRSNPDILYNSIDKIIKKYNISFKGQ